MSLHFWINAGLCNVKFRGFKVFCGLFGFYSIAFVFINGFLSVSDILFFTLNFNPVDIIFRASISFSSIFLILCFSLTIVSKTIQGKQNQKWLFRITGLSMYKSLIGSERIMDPLMACHAVMNIRWDFWAWESPTELFLKYVLLPPNEFSFS